jgi:hypothetical protein
MSRQCDKPTFKKGKKIMVKDQRAPTSGLIKYKHLNSFNMLREIKKQIEFVKKIGTFKKHGFLEAGTGV